MGQTKVYKSKGKIEPEMYSDFAWAICTNIKDEAIIDKHKISKVTVQAYKSYAKGYKTNKELAKTLYKTLNKGIIEWIDFYIEQGEGKTLSYKIKNKKGPQILGPNKPSAFITSPITKPVKEESAQMKLDLKPHKPEVKQEPIRVNDVELVNLMYKALETIGEMCKTIQGLKK